MLPHTIELPTARYTVRRAVLGDLPALIALLADDSISAGRGDRGRPEDVPAYESAFAAIAADPANELLVVMGESDELVATMQLTVIPGLSRVGATRLQIEAVRVSSSLRGRGLGSAMIRWAVAAAPGYGAQLVQLTSDAARTEAHRFYERLGFTASHIGFKLAVPAR